MNAPSLPLPPPELAGRAGGVTGADPLEFYLAEGARLRGLLESLLPADWRWEGKRVLDFGCSSGRVLRHFAAEAERGHFVGCDIDPTGVDWAQANLSPPFRFFRNEASPPLPLAAGSLDLIWATSVFTHITDEWSGWLLELHRLLAPGGILVATYLGEGTWEALVGQPYEEDAVGIAVLRHWDGPGSMVFHSEWWLREHWGRAFDVLEVRRPPRSPDGSAQITHSYLALRRKEVDVSPSELERIDAAEPREMAGLETSLRLARQESALLAAWVRQGRAGLRARLRNSPLGPPVRDIRRRVRRSRGSHRRSSPRT